MITSFDDAFEILLGHEKGFSKNPNDPGNWSSGKVGVGTLEGTMYGISAPVARRNGYSGPMDKLPLDFAKKIAKSEYWDLYKCDQFDARIGFQIFDTAYNGGSPARWLQQALGVTVDGKIGPATIAAAKTADVAKTVALFNASRLDYMAQCPGDTFDDGWMRRVANCIRMGVS